jgi:hypothetical protein
MGGGASDGLGRRDATAPSGLYYRRQAARARRVAEEVTTQAVKARLLDDARYNDELAAKADSAGTEAEMP